ncbi:MAG: CDP-diacylglycerol--glycerol-3-phosphate 3-phosphatidyltransferase [Clostridia bacterium]|nr:CDP-diacylglycerol--glycerol-3-phosphate 3-phosphatidyltransferase [Clostridia bacterium]
MNLPNRITIARIIMIPIYMFFAFPFPDFMPYLGFVTDYKLIFALVIFVVASLTDMLDGKIARKRNIVTDFGKFLDPIADKLLVTVALLSLTLVSKYYIWATMIVLTREFAVTGMRLIAASRGKVIAAGKSGKLKTLTQCIALITLLTAWAARDSFPSVPVIRTISTVLFWAGNIILVFSVIMTIYSGCEYFVKNKDLFKKDEM